MRGTWRPLPVMRRVGQASRWVESQTRPRVIAMFCGEKTMTVKRTILSAMMFVFASPCLVTANSYPWQINEVNPRGIASQIPPPAGFRRIKIESGTFSDWLRHLPMKEKGALVLFHDGKPEANQGYTLLLLIYRDTGIQGYRDQGSSTMCQRNHLAESRVPLLQKEFHRHTFQLHEWI